MMRMESNQAQGIFQQLQAAIQNGLTYRLYSLSGRIETIKSSLEVRCTTYLTYLAYPIIINGASAGDSRSTACHHGSYWHSGFEPYRWYASTTIQLKEVNDVAP